MAAPMTRTPYQAAAEAGRRLDAALLRAGHLDMEPSMAVSIVADGARVHRVRLTSFSIPQARWLIGILGCEACSEGAQSVNKVRAALDLALRRAGIFAAPSTVVVGTVHGRTANKISMPSLSTLNALRLADILEEVRSVRHHG